MHLHFVQSLEPLQGAGLGQAALSLHLAMREKSVQCCLWAVCLRAIFGFAYGISWSPKRPISFAAADFGSQSLGSVGSAPSPMLLGPWKAKLIPPGHADHSVIYKKVSTTNPSGGSSYGEFLQVLFDIGVIRR